MTDENKKPYHDAFEILPDEECIMCAEKHYSYAMELASEIGYIAVNNQKIIGQLVASQWHVAKYDEQLANDMRDIRHLVQERTTESIDWKPICLRLEELIKKDKEASLLKYSESTSWVKSLIGEYEIPQIHLKRISELHLRFIAEKDVGGGCSSCRLKRITGKYRTMLRTLFGLAN